MHSYGLAVSGLPSDGVLVGRPRLPWPRLDLRQVAGPAPRATRVLVGDHSAVLDVADLAAITIDREPLSCTVTAPSPLPASTLTHPTLAFIASVAARWQGRSALHGAAVALGGGAWIVLGAPGSGKSTLSSQLDAGGVVVLADDLSVVEDGTVFAGPRVADLRAASARELGVGEELGTSVGRPRWRVALGPAPYETPVRGFVELVWSDRLLVEPVPVAERLETLARHEALGLGPHGHRSFLDLLRHPVWRIARPALWHDPRATVDALTQLAEAAR